MQVLLAEQVAAELAFSPVTATWLGDHRYDDQLDDVRESSVQAEVARLRALSARLERLSQHRQDLDVQLLLARTRARLQELDELRPHERNPLLYVAIAAHGIDGLLVPELNEGRVRPLTRRLKAIPELCRHAQRNLKNPPELLVRRAAELAHGTASFLGSVLPRLLRSVTSDKLLDEALRAAEEARRALDDLSGWLTREMLPRARGDWALGRQALAARLRWLELLDVPLETVLAQAEARLREVRTQLEEAARRVAGPGGRPIETALRLIEEDCPRPEELLRSMHEALTTAVEAVTRGDLLTLPTTRPRIIEMPPHRWGYATLYLPGPLETRPVEAVLMVDPVDPAWTDRRLVQEHLRALNRTQQLLLIASQAVPGRFVQHQSLRQVLDRLPPVRQRWRSQAFVEGWAHYAEGLLAEALQEPVRSRLQVLALRAELIRLGRLVVVIRLHAGGGPPAARLEEAARYLTEECHLDDHTARREAERAALDPLVMMAALGRMQLRQLVADLAARQPQPALRTLHDAVLRQGELPVVALRRILLSEGAPHRPSP